MSKKDRKIAKLRNKLISEEIKVERLSKDRNKLYSYYSEMKEQKEYFERAYERHKGRINKLTIENKEMCELILNIKLAIKKYENAGRDGITACFPIHEVKIDTRVDPNYDEHGLPLNHKSVE